MQQTPSDTEQHRLFTPCPTVAIYRLTGLVDTGSILVTPGIDGVIASGWMLPICFSSKLLMGKQTLGLKTQLIVLIPTLEEEEKVCVGGAHRLANARDAGRRKGKQTEVVREIKQRWFIGGKKETVGGERDGREHCMKGITAWNILLVPCLHVVH